MIVILPTEINRQATKGHDDSTKCNANTTSITIHDNPNSNTYINSQSNTFTNGTDSSINNSTISSIYTKLNAVTNTYTNTYFYTPTFVNTTNHIDSLSKPATSAVSNALHF